MKFRKRNPENVPTKYSVLIFRTRIKMKNCHHQINSQKINETHGKQKEFFAHTHTPKLACGLQNNKKNDNKNVVNKQWAIFFLKVLAHLFNAQGFVVLLFCFP